MKVNLSAVCGYA